MDRVRLVEKKVQILFDSSLLMHGHFLVPNILTLSVSDSTNDSMRSS